MVYAVTQWGNYTQSSCDRKKMLSFLIVFSSKLVDLQLCSKKRSWLTHRAHILQLGTEEVGWFFFFLTQLSPGGMMLTFCVQRSSSGEMDSRTICQAVRQLPWQGLAWGVDGWSSLIPFACLKCCEMILLPVHLGKERVCFELSRDLALGICLVPARSHGLRLLRVPVGYLGELKQNVLWGHMKIIVGTLKPGLI